MPPIYYTEELLDSMLSLSRFTSLVRWRYVTDQYRPVLAADSPTGMGLYVWNEDLQQWEPAPQSQWLWTGASDKSITVGWIVRNFQYEDVLSDEAQPVFGDEIPTLQINGLAPEPLEMVWFDDRRGNIVERYNLPVPTPPSLAVQIPGTETGGGFGKSIAFLIQPVGYTPHRYFAPLPNEPIGWIRISNPITWDEERPEIFANQGYTFYAHTKPEIDDPNTLEDERGPYYYRWDFGVYGHVGYDGPRYVEGYGSEGKCRITSVRFQDNQGDPAAGKHNRVSLDIEYPKGTRISGDIIHVYLHARP